MPTLADTASALDAQVAAWDEAVDPGTIVLALDSEETDSLAAAVVLKEVTLKQDARGQWSRVQPCLVDVRKALLPDWATADTLPGFARLTTGGKTFKVAEAADQGLTLHLTCFRWPDDPA